MLDNEVLCIETKELFELSESYFSKMCGFHRTDRVTEKIKKKAYKIREQVFTETKMSFVVTELGADAVEDGTLILGENRISCNVFRRIPKENVEKLFLFTTHAPMPDISKLPITELYLADTWQTAFSDAGRDYLKEYLHQLGSSTANSKVYISDAVGPGFYGMDENSIGSFFTKLDAQKAGIEIMPSGMMNPVKSIVGFFMILKDESKLPPADCSNCIGSKSGCHFCKNYKAGAQSAC